VRHLARQASLLAHRDALRTSLVVDGHGALGGGNGDISALLGRGALGEHDDSCSKVPDPSAEVRPPAVSDRLRPPRKHSP
jgi:hypothetical protein